MGSGLLAVWPKGRDHVLPVGKCWILEIEFVYMVLLERLGVTEGFVMGLFSYVAKKELFYLLSYLVFVSVGSACFWRCDDP